jgi:hypothetical protein
MSAAVVVEAEVSLRRTVMTLIFAPGIMFLQCFYTELVMYLWPTAGDQRALYAWLVTLSTLGFGVLWVIIATGLHEHCDAKDETRIMVLMVPLVLLMVAIQPAITETFYAVYLDSKTNRLLAMGIAAFAALILALVVCIIVCNYCACVWKGMERALLSDKKRYKPVETSDR